MGVVIESDVWEPNSILHVFIFCSCCFSIYVLPYLFNYASPATPTLSDLSITSSSSPSFLRFQKSFLLIYSLASVMEGLWSVFGEFELAHQGVSREQMVVSLCAGYVVLLVVGPLLGVLADLIGPKKVCLVFCILHFFVGIWKRITTSPSVWIASICLSLATSIFSFSFETWIVAEHEKLGCRQDSLNETFWLMAFLESASYIGSQVLANWMVTSNVKSSIGLPSLGVVLLATVCAFYIVKGWKGAPQVASFKDYKMSFYGYIFYDKRIWLLGWAHTCLHFSSAVFWILWAPSLVADGRELNLGLIFPCLLGARMLGSTIFPLFIGGEISMRTEEYLLYTFMIMGLILSITAFDYQEVGVLVTVFCLFNACVGLVLPSLSKLRTMYVPNELRGGMISLSLAPANAAILCCLWQGGYYRNICNATILGFAAISLFTAAGCMHQMKRSGKRLHRNWHKL